MTKFHIMLNTQWYKFKLLRIKSQKKKAGGLAKLLKLKIGAKVMLTVNIDIQDPLINGQTGNISHVELGQGKVFVKYT